MTTQPDAAFSVRHTTRYKYSEPVAASLHHAVLKLRTTPWQEIHHSQIRVEPEARDLVNRTDYFGNNLTRFSVESMTQTLKVEVESEVAIKQRDSIAGDSLSVADLHARIHEAQTSEDLESLQFVFESRHIPRSEGLASYAAVAFKGGTSVLDGATALMHRIHSDFTYDPAVTEISTPVEEVLVRREGVCQDFAHVMIGCLRSLDVPARYVSGYLVPLPGVVGDQASHAWVSVYLPDQGWIDFDPTNDVLPSTGHITVAWGRDFADVSPLRGVILGGGSHFVSVEVKVKNIRHW